uniref:Uncharacterized protein n=1 Tax=Calidris pygmaea TaxID=425635 RepID=A0A8C3JIK6_9CHAR
VSPDEECTIALAKSGKGNRASEGTVTVDCTNRRLIEIPRGIPANATNLTLSINDIPYIYQTSFAHLDNLMEIDFRLNTNCCWHRCLSDTLLAWHGLLPSKRRCTTHWKPLL